MDDEDDTVKRMKRTKRTKQRIRINDKWRVRLNWQHAHELASVSFGHSPTCYKVHLGPGLMAPVPFECRTVQDHLCPIEGYIITRNSDSESELNGMWMGNDYPFYCSGEVCVAASHSIVFSSHFHLIGFKLSSRCWCHDLISAGIRLMPMIGLAPQAVAPTQTLQSRKQQWQMQL